jgi:hypothetical protein
MNKPSASRFSTLLETRWNFVSFWTVCAGSISTAFIVLTSADLLFAPESDVSFTFVIYFIGVAWLCAWISGFVAWYVFGALFPYDPRGAANDDKSRQ